MPIQKIYPDIYDPALSGEAEPNLLRRRLYAGVRRLLAELFEVSESKTPEHPKDFPADTTAQIDEVRLAAIIGQLLLSGYDDPSQGRLERGFPSSRDLIFQGAGHEPNPGHPPPDTVPLRVHVVPEFVDQFTQAVRKFNANKGLYTQVFIQLRDKGGGQANGSATKTTIRSKQIAEVTERLITENVSPNDPHIILQVLSAIQQSLGGVVDAHPSALDIDLPELDAGTTVEIIPDNVRAVQAIYFSAQLEEMKLHAVVEKLVEHFERGMIPVTRGSAADKLYAWIKDTPQRLTEIDRRGLYGRVLGLAQGATNDAMPNREFSDLWRRFLATLSIKRREIFSSERDEVSVEQIHKAGRDLAVNISLHGYGMAHPAAIEMQDIVRQTIAIADEPAILRAYGVNDRWQLVDRVATLYLGGAVNGVKYRTLAAAGEKIIRWLADRAPILASSSAAGLSITDIQGNPTRDFLYISDLAERWLAVTGTADESVRQISDPVDLQQQYTVPMLGQQSVIPQSVHDVLSQMGNGINGVGNLPAIPQA